MLYSFNSTFIDLKYMFTMSDVAQSIKTIQIGRYIRLLFSVGCMKLFGRFAWKFLGQPNVAIGR